MPAIRPFYDELNSLYLRLLDRPIDHSGYFTYASLLEQRRHTLAEIEQILKNSEEYRRRRGDQSGAVNSSRLGGQFTAR